jgi:putative tryptophan/tyrosine transport system substrate-binding protein
MEWRVFIGTLAGGLLAAPLAGEGQPAGNVPRVGILGSVPTPSREPFRQTSRELGYVEGRNIMLEYRWLGGGEGGAAAVYGGVQTEDRPGGRHL